MIAMEQRLLSVKEVAERLNVSEGMVKQWLRSKELAGYKLGGIWRVEPVAVDTFLKERSNRKNQNKPTSA